MDSYTFQKFNEIKSKNNVKEMKKLYEQNKNDLSIKFSYAKMLSQKRMFKEARIVLEELIGTSNETYARLELGKLEMKCKNYDLARKHLE